jgi:hypothetical protein
MNAVIHTLLTIFALLIPVTACGFIAFRLKDRNSLNWQTITCFSALAIASSLLLLLVAGEIEFLRYGDTQVNRKLDQIKALTEQNKRIAEATAKLGLALSSMTAYPEIPDIWRKNRDQLVSLLREAGKSDEEIRSFLSEVDSRFPKTNSIPSSQ